MTVGTMTPDALEELMLSVLRDLRPIRDVRATLAAGVIDGARAVVVPVEAARQMIASNPVLGGLKSVVVIRGVNHGDLPVTRCRSTWSSVAAVTKLTRRCCRLIPSALTRLCRSRYNLAPDASGSCIRSDLPPAIPGVPKCDVHGGCRRCSAGQANAACHLSRPSKTCRCGAIRNGLRNMAAESDRTIGEETRRVER